MTSDDNGEKTAAEMVSQLQDFFASREKALKEREDAFEKRLELFDESFPEAGKDSDVLHLNVGGSTNIAVLRRTLTHFQNSMLACRFSGRWDDSIEKDKDGNFFIDQDPQVFGILLKYLRQCDQLKRGDTEIVPPPASYDFCTMLEYYDLMSSVYPQEWRRLSNDDDTVITRSTKDDSLTISTGKQVRAFALEVQWDGSTKPVNAKSFTATFEQGSTGQVGWAVGFCNGGKLGQDEHNVSFAFDLDSSSFMGNRSSVGNGQEWSRTMPVKILCTNNVKTKMYTIEVLGREADAIVIATFQYGNPMYPHINFSGKVTISDVQYVY